MSTPQQARARRGLAIYFACVLVGSGTIQWLLLRTGEPITDHLILALANMWVPSLAALIARVVLREGVGDVSFALRGRHGARMMALAWIYPVVVGGLAYGLAWTMGLASFAAPKMAKLGLEHASPWLKLCASLGLNLTVGTLLSAVSAAGEELGWRGYMLTRLIDSGVRRPLFLSGFIWAVWHLPLILSGQYAAGPYPALSALLFLVSTVGDGYVIARVRLESGSVWPAIVLHSCWNAVIQGTFDLFTVGGSAAHTTSIWIGESGILLVAVDVLVALWLVRRPWPARRTPREEPFASYSLRNG